ncbi:MAG: type II toxin-antitoxin system VapC family toxin, partial [Methylococcales bacterium]
CRQDAGAPTLRLVELQTQSHAVAPGKRCIAYFTMFARRKRIWLRNINPADLYLSVVTIGEIERGIIRQCRINPQFAEDLQRWLDTVLLRHQQRILPLSINIARCWGRLSGELGNNNTDLMIAVTALEHNLTVATRNIRHFEPTQVRLIDPYLAL